MIKNIYIFFSFLVLIVGFIFIRYEKIYIFLFSIPFFFLFFRSRLIKLLCVFFGFFLLFQTFFTPFYRYFKHGSVHYQQYPKNLSYIVNILKDNIVYKSGHFYTDYNGFRTNQYIDYFGKKSDTYRIFLVGSNTLSSAYLGNNEQFSYKLQTILKEKTGKNIQVINSAYPNHNLRQMKAVLIKIKNLNPDLIIIMPGLMAWNQFIKSFFDSQKGSFFYKYFQVFSFEDSFLFYFLDSLKKKIIGYDKTYFQFSLPRGRQSIRNTYVSDEFKKDLDDCFKMLSDFKIPVLFLTQPTAYLYKNISNSFCFNPLNEDYYILDNDMHKIVNIYNSYLINQVNKNGYDIFDSMSDVNLTESHFFNDIELTVSGIDIYSRSLSKRIYPFIEKK